MTEAITNAAPAAPPNLATCTPGEYLRRLREEKGHTHAAVGTALHLTVHYIKALESDEYGKLPGLTFVKGYLRSYARFLGADVDNVLARFDEHITGLLDAGKHTERVERSRRRQDQALRWAIGAGFVVVAGLVAGWWFMRDAAPANSGASNASQQVAVQQTAAAPTPAAAAVPPPAFTAPLQDTVTANAAQDTFTASSDYELAQGVVTEFGSFDAPTEESLEDGSAASGFDAVAAVTTEALEQGAAATGEAATAPDSGGIRQVSLIGAGSDLLRVSFRGDSWVEVDDASQVRLYNDMLGAGDTLTIRGQAPFRVLLGDAANVDVSLNQAAVDISADIRTDRTARLVLGTATPAAPATASGNTASFAPTSSEPAPAAGAEVTQ